MVHAARRIKEWTGRGRALFLSDELVQWAVLRGLQTLTESATRLSEEVKARHPDIAWTDVAGFRNIVTHAYLGRLSIVRVWEYIQRDLPTLLVAAEEELRRLNATVESEGARHADG